MYIAIEGIDTAGKSTQIEALKSHFSDGVFTKEPGGSELGVKIRELVLHSDIKSPIAELFLFLADRAEHIERVILNNTDSLIISDRSVISGVAYAMSSGVFDEQKIIELNRLATNNTLPDISFILTLDRETLEYRLSQKSSDAIESRGVDYLLDIQQHLIDSSKKMGIQTITIDASKSIENITAEIIKKIEDSR